MRNHPLSLVGAAVIGAMFALPASAQNQSYDPANRSVTSPRSPARVPEAAPGVPTMPARNNPASVSESAPEKTGKEVSSAPVADDKRMANPQTPANVSESAPARTGQEPTGIGATR
jgi:hypothetical protein